MVFNLDDLAGSIGRLTAAERVGSPDLILPVDSADSTSLNVEIADGRAQRASCPVSDDLTEPTNESNGTAAELQDWLDDLLN
jgi:hypothetical protein